MRINLRDRQVSLVGICTRNNHRASCVNARCEGFTPRLKSARGLHSTEQTQRGPHIEHRRPIFYKYDSEQDWLILKDLLPV